jgi:hypothetical protein
MTGAPPAAGGDGRNSRCRHLSLRDEAHLDFLHLHFKWRGNLQHLTKPFSLREFSLCFAHGI